MDDSNRAPVDSTSAAAPRAGVNTQLLIVLGALALTALLYWPTSLEIVELWNNVDRRTYTHGWIVLAVSLWLIWRERDALACTPLSPSILGGLLVLAGSFAWLVSHFAGLITPSMLALPPLALAAILAAGGWSLASRTALPVLFLYFGLPVWDEINTSLQAMTAHVNHWLTRLAGIPAVLEEYVIHIPAGWFEVAGGCSGLHFFIVAVAIATLDGQLNRASLRTRLLLVALAGSLAILTNWLRVFIVIAAGHVTDMQHFLVKVDHYYFGWVLFAFALIGYVYLAGRLSRAADKPAASPSSVHPGSSARVLPKAPVVLPLVAMALALGPLWLYVRSTQHDVREPLAAPALAGWTGPELLISDWQPVFANADEEFKVAYRQEPAADVAVYRAAYHAQRQGKELRGYENTIVGSNYSLESSGIVTLNVQGARIDITEQQVRAGDGRQLLIWSLYGVGGRPAAMNLRDQLLYGVRSLVDAPTASVAAFATDCHDDCAQARPLLEALAVQALPGML